MKRHGLKVVCCSWTLTASGSATKAWVIEGRSCPPLRSPRFRRRGDFGRTTAIERVPGVSVSRWALQSSSNMPRAVILSAVRTPVGRYGGALSGVRPDDLAGRTIAVAVERSGVDPAEICEVYFGCANQAGEDNRNVARMAGILAGLPPSVAGVTINRLCASGLSAVVEAARAVVTGEGDLFVAGGVESMSRAPLAMAKGDRPFARGDQTVYDTALGWRFPNPRMAEMFPLEQMGETAENVAERYGVAREDQDAFALRSQRRWAAADSAGRFADELVALDTLVRDEHPRPDTSIEALSALRAVFRKGGTVTAGNSSGLADGAAALVDRVGGKSTSARPRAARGLRHERGCRGRPEGDGDRARRRGPDGACPGRTRARRDRSRRAERGVRVASRRGVA